MSREVELTSLGGTDTDEGLPLRLRIVDERTNRLSYAIESIKQFIEEPQYVRDIVLGLNDGLISTFLLVVEMWIEDFSRHDILAIAFAGGMAGALSMGLGEYLATDAQNMANKKERDEHVRSITAMTEQFGKTLLQAASTAAAAAAAGPAAAASMSGMDQLIKDCLSHEAASMDACLDGILERERSPWKAMTIAFVVYLTGSLASVVPFLVFESADYGFLFATVVVMVLLFLVGFWVASTLHGTTISSGLSGLL